jgi:hypothetical protein
MSAAAASGPYQDFYAAMQSNDTMKISSQISAIEKSEMKEKDAYAGALMMRMSGLVKSGMDKLKIFKQGRVKLEQCIKQDSLNVEYRFLRLMIQEHIPDFMNYHSKKTEDARIIRESYGRLQTHLQEAIKDYSLHSKILKPEDFQK